MSSANRCKSTVIGAEGANLTALGAGPPATDDGAKLLGTCGDPTDFGELIDDAVGEDTEEALECCLYLSFFIKCSAPPKPFLRSVPPTDFILSVVVCVCVVE